MIEDHIDTALSVSGGAALGALLRPLLNWLGLRDKIADDRRSREIERLVADMRAERDRAVIIANAAELRADAMAAQLALLQNKMTVFETVARLLVIELRRSDPKSATLVEVDRMIAVTFPAASVPTR